MRKLMSAVLALSLFGAPVSAQQPADPYAPAKAIVADVNRIVTPNGVQENLVVTLGGARQAINVRGADRNNPILVFVHGGPGAVEMPFAWAFQRPWEDVFTVVQYDQRGAGRRAGQRRRPRAKTLATDGMDRRSAPRCSCVD